MILLAALALSASLIAQQPEEPLVLTMQDAVRLALSQNRSVKVAAHAVEEAQAALRKAWAAQRVTVAGQASISAQGPTAEFMVPMPSGPPASITIVPNLSWQLGLRVNQPIYSGGRLFYQEELAKLGLDTARIQHQRAKQQVVRDVRRLFLAVAQTQQLEAVARENVRRAERHLQDAKARVEAGVAPGFDVIRAEAEVANARNGLVAAQAAVEKALAALKTLLSIDVTRPVRIQVEAGGKGPQIELSQAISKALNQRPEVRAADKAVQMAEIQMRLARATKRPQIDLFATWGKQSLRGFGGHDWNWTVGVQARKLFADGGLERAAIAEAAAKKAQAEQAAKQVREAVALEVFNATVALREAQEKIQAAKKAVAQAEEAMRIADLRYREGVAPAVEVTDARAALIAARANLVNAQFEYERAKVDLEYAMGVSVDEIAGTGRRSTRTDTKEQQGKLHSSAPPKKQHAASARAVNEKHTQTRQQAADRPAYDGWPALARYQTAQQYLP